MTTWAERNKAPDGIGCALLFYQEKSDEAADDEDVPGYKVLTCDPNYDVFTDDNDDGLMEKEFKRLLEHLPDFKCLRLEQWVQNYPQVGDDERALGKECFKMVEKVFSDLNRPFELALSDITTCYLLPQCLRLATAAHVTKLSLELSEHTCPSPTHQKMLGDHLQSQIQVLDLQYCDYQTFVPVMETLGMMTEGPSSSWKTLILRNGWEIIEEAGLPSLNRCKATLDVLHKDKLGGNVTSLSICDLRTSNDAFLALLEFLEDNKKRIFALRLSDVDFSCSDEGRKGNGRPWSEAQEALETALGSIRVLYYGIPGHKHKAMPSGNCAGKHVLVLPFEFDPSEITAATAQWTSQMEMMNEEMSMKDKNDDKIWDVEKEVDDLIVSFVLQKSVQRVLTAKGTMLVEPHPTKRQRLN